MKHYRRWAGTTNWTACGLCRFSGGRPLYTIEITNEKRKVECKNCKQTKRFKEKY